MHIYLIGGLAALAVTTASPVLAKTVAKGQSVVEQGDGSAAAAEEKKLCKRLQNTGTRMKNERVCLTKAEWKKVDAMH